nr:hypothetical protein [Tanacetum cinerariifolium]
MSTQQDIYAAGSESRPPMLNKENYVPWSSRLLRYAKSRPNEKIEADDQAIQTILFGLPEDIYAAVDSCETAQEIWLRVQQMMKGSDIGIQEKKAKLFNEWERSYNYNEYGTRINGKSIQAKLLNTNQQQSKNFIKPEEQANCSTGNEYGSRQTNADGWRNQVIQHAVHNPRVQNVGNQNVLIGVQGNGNQNQIRNGNLVEAHTEGNATGQNGNQIRCYNCRGVDLDEIEEVNANCILMANLQQASNSDTQTDKEQYTELLEPIPESHQVPPNDNVVISEDTSVEQGGETVEQHPANFKETRALYESLYHNLAIEVKKVNSVNRKLKETIADMTTELARYKNQERYFENSQEKYDKLERCYQQSVYQEQCLSKKINALYLSNEETLQLAQESRNKMKQMNKEIKPANYTKINHLSGVFVPQMALSRKEFYFSNNSKTATVSKSFSIPNEDLSDDTSPSVARKFLNDVKSTIMTLQRVVKQRMTIETHNWSSSAHQELHKIVRVEIFPIVNQVDARLQNFEIQFLKVASKFVADFKSLANEADASLVK